MQTKLSYHADHSQKPGSESVVAPCQPRVKCDVGIEGLLSVKVVIATVHDPCMLSRGALSSSALKIYHFQALDYCYIMYSPLLSALTSLMQAVGTYFGVSWQSSVHSPAS